MPIYSYLCAHCGAHTEQIVSYAGRDTPPERHHDGCGGLWQRAGVEAFTQGKPRHQMQAVLANGTHVKGHFGKTAPLLKKKK